MFCSGCGHALAPGQAFCAQCGRPSAAVIPPIPGLQFQLEAYTGKIRVLAIFWFIYAGLAMLTGFAGLAFVLSSIHHWLLNPDRNMALVLIPVGLVSILVGIALLVVTTTIYVLGRDRMRTTSQGFSSAPHSG